MAGDGHKYGASATALAARNVGLVAYPRRVDAEEVEDKQTAGTKTKDG